MNVVSKNTPATDELAVPAPGTCVIPVSITTKTNHPTLIVTSVIVAFMAPGVFSTIETRGNAKDGKHVALVRPRTE